jgi:hypothetical protein
MPLSQDKIIYGIHSFTPYRRSDRLPYGIMKVIGSANLGLSAEQELLYAGSNKFPWAAESKTVSSEISAKVKAYPGFLFELFLGATVTEAGADAAGTIAGLANAKGTSVSSAVTGFASLSVIPSTGAANLKFGKYVAKAVSATTIDLYLLSDIEAKRGTAVSYVDDSLKINASPLTLTNGGNIDYAPTGIRFVGGSAVALVVGDTAIFEVLPPSQKSSKIKVGSSDTTFPAFGAVFLAQKRATGEMFEVEAFNVVANGLPISMEEQAFSQPEIKMVCLYDAVKDTVFEIRHILP